MVENTKIMARYYGLDLFFRGQLSDGSSPSIKGLYLWMHTCLLAWDENNRKYRHHNLRNYTVAGRRKGNLETKRCSNTGDLPIMEHFTYSPIALNDNDLRHHLC